MSSNDDDFYSVGFGDEVSYNYDDDDIQVESKLSNLEINAQSPDNQQESQPSTSKFNNFSKEALFNSAAPSNKNIPTSANFKNANNSLINSRNANKSPINPRNVNNSPTNFRNTPPQSFNQRNEFNNRGYRGSSSSTFRGNYQMNRQNSYSLRNARQSTRQSYNDRNYQNVSPRQAYNEDYQSSRQTYNDRNYQEYPQSSCQTYNENQDYPQSRQSQNEEYSNNEESEDELEDSDDDEQELEDLPEIVRQILTKTRSYSEKMAIIGERILIQTTIATAHGGYNNLDLLKAHFSEDCSYDSDKIADLMGYNSFVDLCLNAPEVVELHKWKYSETGAVLGYQPVRLGKSNAKLVNDKIIGVRARELKNDEIGRYIEELKTKNELPTVKELDFKYRLCQTMIKLDGMKVTIELGKLKLGHQALHGEVLNSKTYREMYSLKTNHNFNEIQKQKLRVEMIVRSNVTNTGLIFKLKNSLEFIKIYHDRVKVEIEKKEAEDREKEGYLRKLGYTRFSAPQKLAQFKPSDFNKDPFESRFEFQ